MKKYPSAILAISLLLASLAGSPRLALADKAKAADYYEDAVMLLNKGEPKSAIIQLKNALQQDPDLLPAYVLSGKAYLADGDAASAEESLLKAKLLGRTRP